MKSLQGRLIVSCQAWEGDPFRDSRSMAEFARAAAAGGAAGIRANGPEDVRAIRGAVAVPIIGIQKVLHTDGQILITPSLEAAGALVGAGASAIALDCTRRGQAYGALERIKQIRAELKVPVLADIATVEEATAAAGAGADYVLSTLRGYTPETAHIRAFEPAFITELVRAVRVPVIAEGRIETPDQARQALAAGAFAVVVGSAITRPQEITRRFAEALAALASGDAYYAAIDLGGTNTKFGIVRGDGVLAAESYVPTPAGGGRDVLLNHLKAVARRAAKLASDQGLPLRALGVATAGWVDRGSGRVAYATENLPGWTGTPIGAELEAEVSLPVAVENDANAAAVAEKHFGAARQASDFVCITLGTGVGGGCYTGGRLNTGRHFFANALGHICIEPDGLPCTCGRRGCLEVYSNAAALVRFAGEPSLDTAEKVIQAANAGHAAARRTIRVYAGYLAAGCATIIHLLDPQMIVLTGGVAQNNPALLDDLREELARRVMVWDERRLDLRTSPLGYYAGVLGAAAIAREKVPAAL